jgi:toxin CcdB
VSQFAVYPYRGRSEDILFLVQIQSRRLDRDTHRMAIPLIRLGYQAPPNHPLTPHMTIQDRTVYADPLDLAAIPASRLGTPIMVLSERVQDRIIQSIDEMISRT